MNLPNDIARCDGLLPKGVTMPDGTPGVLWSIDCPKREECARYQQIWRDGDRVVSYGVTHFHKPTEPCPDFIQE